jgi:dephospho-CoA kinase
MIIGITGTFGAGKGTIVEYLQKKGFVHFSVREYLVKQIKKQNLEVNRDNMVKVANNLRKEHSPSYIIEELYKEAEKTGKDSVIESIRNVGEINKLKELGDFYLFAVDANPKIRYERLSKRGTVTDDVSFKRFLEEEKREMNNPDPNKQNLAKCIEMADFRFQNNGSFEDLYNQVEKTMDLIKNN